ncbi:MAG TPA: helix-turn-helix domain-containing protein [Flavisolibacter sp.]
MDIPKNETKKVSIMGIFLQTNLTVLRKSKKLTQTEAASSMGFKRSTYNNYESGHTEPNIEALEKIASFFGISVDDLLFKDLRESNLIALSDNDEKGNNLGNLSGNLLPKNETEPSSEEGPSFYVMNKDLRLIKSLPKVVTVDTAGDENTVMVPVRARAGYTSGYGDPHFIERLPVYKLPGMNNGTYRIFEVEGLSMFPTLQDKDLAIARWTPLSEIREDRVHVLVTATKGVIIKRILSRLKEGILICKSDHNERGHYPNIVLEADEVVECWYVVERMTKHLPSPGEIYKRITDLEADIALIKHKLMHD